MSVQRPHLTPQPAERCPVRVVSARETHIILPHLEDSPTSNLKWIAVLPEEGDRMTQSSFLELVQKAHELSQRTSAIGMPLTARATKVVLESNGHERLTVYKVLSIEICRADGTPIPSQEPNQGDGKDDWWQNVRV